MESFLLFPLLAIILISTASSILGVFVLWKKLAYFGDALSHAILFGLICGAFFEINQIFALMIFAIIFAGAVSSLSQNRYFNKGTIVMILSYFCVALAIVLNDVFSSGFNFTSYIFGDVLTVGSTEITALTAITCSTIFYSIFAFRKILLINANPDLAKISGIKTERWNASFLILLSLTIAFSVQIVGILLMTALLILPASIARIFSTSAKQMMVLSLIIGITISATSFAIANRFNLTLGPTIIVIFGIIFFLSLIREKLREKL
ncbi:MAG: hypothetical protein A2887_01230 [Alphaproteobacteria bacterium RIFCSPLOWO2_01_FULL_40_26]|nr:MAG: hypothetical protein A3D15_05480 [Alphaproteobacteria bacterium RIFCSPHIGHO2_02_FULL_40_34]OFW86681.1 MAG: hypothetical protein A2794_04750 [Alphaproteobacteria bacterium RIFCSPHIGHO2_01_FULL_40_8]OFW94019.1 MAG: hypothetical protein A2887_01230 [Alphaproteobacteria bacterium RIFCSPLOWO2_01_FULL_40_26]OFX09554.1 MAG: hypothetical protein A3H30_05720 [Alphaproteobacteria bacterium RIFCSPLOWO2_02_FULL_40_19]OFX11002.1 MAG: hypothetical protein A3G22_00275 [Alphaproteobacteria bacterium RI